MSMLSEKNTDEKKGGIRKPLSKWVRFTLWGLLTIAFTFWTSSLWWLLALPFFFDLYITRLLPWGFWKKSTNSTFKSIMDWVDAIVFALAAVYVINLYFFQNYQIPSSSLEKSLLVGDFLFVSKVSYGPRVPFTPIAFPLAQHTLPILNSKSYFDKPLWKYKRVPGLAKINRNDIVVFNFPAGDTLPLKWVNPDYYYTCYDLAKRFNVSIPEARTMVRQHPETFGEVIHRPVDRRENYVKRCIGLPGETLQIIDNKVFINGKHIEDQSNVQHNYYIQTKGEYISDNLFRKWGVSKEDRILENNNEGLIQALKFKVNQDGSVNPVYNIPATKSLIETIRKSSGIEKVVLEPDVVDGTNIAGYTYPLNDKFTWTRDNFGPLWIPAKGATIKLTEDNLILYERVIRNYEGNQLEVQNGIAYINGKKADSYTFQMDYYWMMGDNRHKSADSRSWGFVPEDHVVGKPICVWLSLDKDRSLFDGKIRWNRFFKKAY